jgi:hypothetical protein
MPLMSFEITSRVAYAGNRRFGAVGAYEQVDGTAHFAIDPIHPANARICDLKLAPRNAAGLVEFTTDLSVVLPVDAAQANGRCIVELPNRGRRRVVAMMNCSPPDAPLAPQAHPGDGFLFARGYTVAGNGTCTRARSCWALPRLRPWRATNLLAARRWSRSGQTSGRRHASSPIASTGHSRPQPGSSWTRVCSCATGRTVRTL